MRSYIFIPARYKSSRFPGKPLAIINGKPMIHHVIGRCIRSQLCSAVFVATDDIRIFDEVCKTTAKPIMTSDSCLSGTDRIQEAVSALYNEGHSFNEDDIILNVQGDEPLIDTGLIDSLIKIMITESPDIATAACLITQEEVFYDSNVVKVVLNNYNYALYFSRSPIPFKRDDTCLKRNELYTDFTAYQHIGIYAYTVKSLRQFTLLKQSDLELTERLEQLRALQSGMQIKVLKTDYTSIGVDTPKDIEKVERCLSLYS